MKVVTHAHLESWRASVPALTSVDYGEPSPAGLTPIICTFDNVLPRAPVVKERYLLDTRAA